MLVTSSVTSSQKRPKRDVLKVDNCIFCKIIKGEIPCSKVYEDKDVLAFLDLNPAAQGHTLVLPKQHMATLLELNPGTGDALLQAMRKIGRALKNVTAADGFNCIQNNFAAAGQEVLHLHWHVIPRREADKIITAWKPTSYPDVARMGQLAGQLHADITCCKS
jgi:histidine triad (HIT) family protein